MNIPSVEENTKPFGFKKLTLSQRRAVVEEFRDALKVGVPDEMRVVHAHSPEAFGPGSKYGVYPLNDAAVARLKEDENLYYCVAAVKPYTYADTGNNGWRRTQECIGAGVLVGFDDIGTKTVKKCGEGLDFFEKTLPPTAVIETSPGNFQVLYFLDTPILDVHKYGDVLRSIIKPLSDRYGIDKLADVNRVLRLPFGINNKTLEDGSLKYPDADGNPWRVRLVSADYDLRYSPEEIAAAYGLKIVRTPRKAEIEKRVAGRDEDQFKATGFDLLAEAYTKAGRAWPARTEAGRKYRICCPFEGEHASGVMNDDAFIADPAASKNGHFTFACSHGSCNRDSDAYAEGRRTFAAAMTEAGVANDAWRAAEKIERKELAVIERRLRRANLVALRGTTVEEWLGVVEADAKRMAESASESKIDENVSETPEPKTEEPVESKRGASAADAAQEASGTTQWAEGWYYLAARDRVVRPGSLTTYSKQGFDALFAREQKVEGGKAFDFVRKLVGFAHADGMAYLAGAAPVFLFQGQTLVNEFIPSSIPQPAASYTDDGLAAVETIRYHLTLLTGEYKLSSAERKYAQMLESWIALNVRSPGKIIGIAPLIKGIQGDGKTVIFNKMMAALLGAQNVKEASTKEVCSDFNPYAYGAAVRVIEELRMAGENRFAVADGIKPNITNAVVRVVAKRANGIDLPNATNYVALTNHADAVPIDDTDRRWFIVFTPWAHIDELAAVVGDIKAYFTRLHSTIEANADALVKYFKEDCAMHADFFHGMRAPSTPWRGEVIDQEQALIGGDFFASYVENGEHGVSREIVVTDLLASAFERDMPRETVPKTRQVSRLLKAKKWHRVPGVVKIAGKARVVYVADPRILEMGDELRNAKLRDLFAATVPADYEKNRTQYEGAGGF